MIEFSDRNEAIPEYSTETPADIASNVAAETDLIVGSESPGPDAESVIDEPTLTAPDGYGNWTPTLL